MEIRNFFLFVLFFVFFRDFVGRRFGVDDLGDGGCEGGVKSIEYQSSGVCRAYGDSRVVRVARVLLRTHIGLHAVGCYSAGRGCKYTVVPG